MSFLPGHCFAPSNFVVTRCLYLFLACTLLEKNEKREIARYTKQLKLETHVPSSYASLYLMSNTGNHHYF